MVVFTVKVGLFFRLTGVSLSISKSKGLPRGLYRSIERQSFPVPEVPPERGSGCRLLGGTTKSRRCSMAAAGGRAILRHEKIDLTNFGWHHIDCRC
jgi:hypothetical protein